VISFLSFSENMKELTFEDSDWLLETNIRVQVRVRSLGPVSGSGLWFRSLVPVSGSVLWFRRPALRCLQGEEPVGYQVGRSRDREL